MKLDDFPPFSLGNTIQLVGAIYAGNGNVFLVPVPGERETVELSPVAQSMGGYDVLYLSPDEWTEFLRRTDLQEVEVSDGPAKAIVRKTQRQIDSAISWQVYRRDGYQCRYCGRNDVPLTVDHLVLWEEGGPSIPENLLSSCRKCNRVRGNTPYDQWMRHPYYLGKAHMGQIAPAVHNNNLHLVATLGDIPRESRVRSR